MRIKRSSFIVGLILLITLVISIFYATPYLYNNFLVAQMLKSVKGIDFSDNTRRVALKKRFGLLWGNSNHCDVEVNILIQSDLSVADFVTMLEERNLIDAIQFPFTSHKHHDLFFADHHDIYWIYGKSKYRMGKSKSDQASGYIPEGEVSLPDFGLEDPDYKNLVMLAMQAPSHDRAHYILRLTDQTFSDFNSNDWRCQ